jgi:hypothetical protein
MLAFERLAEEKIREAIAAGEFDRLPGKGKPLILDEPIGLRAEDRMAFFVLKNSGFLPEYLLYRKEVETCLSELERFFEHCRQRLGKILNHPAAEERGTKFRAKAWERGERQRLHLTTNACAAPNLRWRAPRFTKPAQ